MPEREEDPMAVPVPPHPLADWSEMRVILGLLGLIGVFQNAPAGSREWDAARKALIRIMASMLVESGLVEPEFLGVRIEPHEHPVSQIPRPNPRGFSLDRPWA